MTHAHDVPAHHPWRFLWDVTALPTTRELSVRRGPLPPAPGEGTVLSLMNRDVRVHWTAHDLWIGGALHLQSGLTRSVLTLGTDDVTAEAAALAMTELHRAGDWLPLHASVVARGGHAVAITGPSGAGKSTALLRLLQQGYDVIAEDRSVWHAPTGLIVGMDRSLRAYTRSLELFAPDWLGRLPLPQDQHGKWQLPLAELQSAPTAPARLRRLLLLGAPPHHERSASVRAVWEATGRPLLPAGAHATQRGVQRLLLQVGVQGVNRDTVMSAVQTLLPDG
ncbi:hypothetical protein [Deinococcus soli (ex Cha et al. 2016)]|uniref:hypothetical protein n=1 Tax=Deinococcus soli (ex Cha et al. 2016) TaxID=1309411 RepID=UPI0016693289|nr:hypothetical protein [Deinococcus soli (ex Cha et al. 2016)]